jgi:GH15 family glucan-1,4-alpha-glucosidase
MLLTIGPGYDRNRISWRRMRKTLRPRAFRLLLAAVLLVMGAPVSPVAAQTATDCYDAQEPTAEKYGPTDITAVSGNRGLSVGLNSDATVTVFKWPSPSFYDQIKYRTTDRAQRRLGALPNEGAFFGLAWREGATDKWDFEWLRQWNSSQRFVSANGDEVATTFRNRDVGLEVVVRDVVAEPFDVFSRRVSVRRMRTSKVTSIRVFSFVNYNPVVSKRVREPINDWCTEGNNDAGGLYEPEADAILHERSGTDASTGNPSSVALAMAFDGRSDGHQVGRDTFQTGVAGTAYSDSVDADLSGSDEAPGQADGAMFDQLSFGRADVVTTTVLMAAAPTQEEVVDVLGSARRQSFSRMSDAKQRWWSQWLKSVPLPRRAPTAVVGLAKRALITLRQNTAPGGLIVTSIATQAPMGLDWIRHGAYMNRALDIAGFHGPVTKHNLRYSELQASVPTEGVPPGNWAPNYYADGALGGIFPHQIPYEIDETGLGMWTLWDHYLQTKDTAYLFAVYPEIRLAASYLTEACRDLTTNLQCVAHEEDNPLPRRTIVGAQAAWLGLDSAVKAAKVVGEQEDANRLAWEARRQELGTAIDQSFYDGDCNCYTQDYLAGGSLLWPVRFLDSRPARMQAQADVNWRHFRRVLNGDETVGRLESRALLGNAHAWADRAGKLKLIKEALKWIARVPTTDETGLLGEAWEKYPRNRRGRITTMVSQPHAWNQAMFYLAALQVYGKTSP